MSVVAEQEGQRRVETVVLFLLSRPLCLRKNLGRPQVGGNRAGKGWQVDPARIWSLE